MSPVKKLLPVLVLTAAVLAIAMSAVSAAGSDEIPSIRAKPAPTVAAETVTVGGIALDTREIIITPLSAAGEALASGTDGNLRAVYREITTSEDKIEAWIPNLAETARQVDSGLDIRDLVVTDLFDLTIPADAEAALEGGGRLTLTFGLGVDAGTDVILATRCPGRDWNAIPARNNGDGTVTVTFTELCPILVLTEADFAVPADPSVLSPKTGADDVTGAPNMLIAACGSLCAMAAACAIYRKRADKV